jgi:hypothetical protein
MWRLMVALALLLAACGGPVPTPGASPDALPGATAPLPSDPPSGGEPQASDTSGPFQLTFVLPRTTWSSEEAITGKAVLSLTEGRATAISGPGRGLLAFAFREVGGTHEMGPGWTMDCASHPLAAGQPIESGITKSGGFTDEQPDAGFYRSFFWDPLVHLPAGTWDITATTEFSEGAGCSGARHALSATIRVLVTD